MSADEEIGFPRGSGDERELLLRWLGYLRGAVRRKAGGLDEEAARWTPDGCLIPLLGLVRHLTQVERRWIDGAVLGGDRSRSEDEFAPGPELPLAAALGAYQERAAATDAVVRAAPSLDQPCARTDGDDARDLRWVLLHLINETARHAGHADAVRELLDGTTGE